MAKKPTEGEVETDRGLHEDMLPDDKLPKKLLDELRAKARKLGVPEGVVVR